MRDPMLDRLADVLVRYSTRVRAGDLVAISGEPDTLPAIGAIYEAVLRAGGHPFWKPESSALGDLFYAHASDEQLAYLSPLELDAIEKVDVRITLWAETNTKRLSRVDPEKVAATRQARRPFMKRFFEKTAEGTLRWVGTEFPGHASAQDAEMSLPQYERFVFEAGLLHQDDPVARWQEVERRQQLVVDWLQQRRELHFRAPAEAGHDGTDLRVSVDPSRSVWVNCAGHENFPDGEVFAGPQGVDGHVNYTFPAVYNGREVEGVRLVFKGGRVVDATARKNEAFLHAMLDQDDGARNLGEIAIGTNYAIREFTKNTLFDEKIGGTFHAACGAGYPESGSDNESGLHWDMVCDLRRGGTIAADGTVFHKDGLFLQEGWPGPVG